MRTCFSASPKTVPVPVATAHGRGYVVYTMTTLISYEIPLWLRGWVAPI